MARRKRKERGRPPKIQYPPRTDATVDELVTAFFRGKPGQVIETPKTYRCSACGEAIHYPKVLHRDGRCEDCHVPA